MIFHFPKSTKGFPELAYFLGASFFALLAVPVFKKNDNSIRDVSFTLFGILYAVVPFITLNLLVSNNGYDPKLVLGIIFLIWSSDTFAYLGGSIFGKNKMIERISPGKTWEGTIIGVIFDKRVLYWRRGLFLAYVRPFSAGIGNYWRFG